MNNVNLHSVFNPMFTHTTVVIFFPEVPSLLLTFSFCLIFFSHSLKVNFLESNYFSFSLSENYLYFNFIPKDSFLGYRICGRQFFSFKPENMVSVQFLPWLCSLLLPWRVDMEGWFALFCFYWMIGEAQLTTDPGENWEDKGKAVGNQPHVPSPDSTLLVIGGSGCSSPSSVMMVRIGGRHSLLPPSV